jgi:hypothetical protein
MVTHLKTGHLCCDCSVLLAQSTLHDGNLGWMKGTTQKQLTKASNPMLAQGCGTVCFWYKAHRSVVCFLQHILQLILAFHQTLLQMIACLLVSQNHCLSIAQLKLQLFVDSSQVVHLHLSETHDSAWAAETHKGCGTPHKQIVG